MKLGADLTTDLMTGLEDLPKRGTLDFSCLPPLRGKPDDVLFTVDRSESVSENGEKTVSVTVRVKVTSTVRHRAVG